MVELHWEEPMTAEPLDLDDPGQSALADQIDAAAGEALVSNEATEDRDRQEGRFVPGEPEFVHRLRVLFSERLFSEPHLTCPHQDEITVWTCLSGPLLVLACQRPACQAALEVHLAETAGLRYCAMCTDRSPSLSILEIGVAIEPGRLLTLVHRDCCPPLPSEVWL